MRFLVGFASIMLLAGCLGPGNVYIRQGSESTDEIRTYAILEKRHLDGLHEDFIGKASAYCLDEADGPDGPVPPRSAELITLLLVKPLVGLLIEGIRQDIANQIGEYSNQYTANFNALFYSGFPASEGGYSTLPQPSFRCVRFSKGKEVGGEFVSDIDAIIRVEPNESETVFEAEVFAAHLRKIGVSHSSDEGVGLALSMQIRSIVRNGNSGTSIDLLNDTIFSMNLKEGEVFWEDPSVDGNADGQRLSNLNPRDDRAIVSFPIIPFESAVDASCPSSADLDSGIDDCLGRVSGLGEGAPPNADEMCRRQVLQSAGRACLRGYSEFTVTLSEVAKPPIGLTRMQSYFASVDDDLGGFMVDAIESIYKDDDD